MKRTGLAILAVALGALGACGSDNKGAASTTPAMEETPIETPAVEAPAGETPAEVPVAEPAKPAPPPAPTYLHGKWVWFELTTSDVDAAKAFYGELLGWKVEARDMNGMTMNAIKNGDKEIGLIQALPADAKKNKMSPLWMGYISVPDVDAAVTAATGAGAKVTMPAMDMAPVGRFATLTDPSGAMFGVVKTLESDEADHVPAIGEFVWMEHQGKDAKKVAEAAAFYAKVAGYEIGSMKAGKVDYTLGKAAGVDRMGFAKAAKSAWAGKFAPYVMVADVDATVKLATKLKAKVVAKASDMPNVGRIAMLADPQGALFAVMTPAPMGVEGGVEAGGEKAAGDKPAAPAPK